MKNLLSFVLSMLASMSLSRAEDLTTLDGHTFTNITQVDKYPNLIVFTYNGTRKTTATTNLPDEFRAKHGIAVKTNTPTVATVRAQPQLSPVDVFLWQNRESKLEQRIHESITTNLDTDCDLYKSWNIILQSAEVELSVFKTTTFFEGGKIKDTIESTEEMTFDTGDENSIVKLFDKFLEWDSVATSKNAENCVKEIGTRKPTTDYILSNQRIFGSDYPNGICTYTFKWENKQSELNVFQPDAKAGNFDKQDIIHFQSLMTNLPSMKEKLAAAIQNQDRQKDLFR